MDLQAKNQELSLALMQHKLETQVAQAAQQAMGGGGMGESVGVGGGGYGERRWRRGWRVRGCPPRSSPKVQIQPK